jgi:hypothetical protein
MGRKTGAELEEECHRLYGMTRDQRLTQLPPLDPVQIEQLRQLATATWDGNVISKQGRDSLFRLSLIDRWEGWQIVNRYGLAVLETLGYLKD